MSCGSSSIERLAIALTITPARKNVTYQPEAPAMVVVSPCNTMGKTLAGASGWYEPTRSGGFRVNFHPPVAQQETIDFLWLRMSRSSRSSLESNQVSAP